MRISRVIPGLLLLVACSSSSGPPVPAAPTGLTASVDGYDIVLEWQDNATDETGYVVRRRTDGQDWTDRSLPANTTKWRDTQTSPTTLYVYVVHAENGNGRSGGSNEVERRRVNGGGGGCGGCDGCLLLLEQPPTTVQPLAVALATTGNGTLVAEGTLDRSEGRVDLDGGAEGYSVELRAPQQYEPWIHLQIAVDDVPFPADTIGEACFAFHDPANGPLTRGGHVELHDRPVLRLSLPGLDPLPLVAGAPYSVDLLVNRDRTSFTVRVLGAFLFEDLPIDTVIVTHCQWLE